MSQPSQNKTPNSAAAEDWFRALFEKSADAMALLDPETGLFVDCNEASAKAIRAGSREALIGRRPTDMTTELQPDGRSSRTFIEETIQRVLTEGSHRFEWQMRRLDGSTTWSEIVATAITLHGRTLIFTTSRNIEERKQMESELRVSESRWRRVFEQMPMSMQVFAPDGTTRQVNAAFNQLFQMLLPDLDKFNIRTDEQLASAGLSPLIERAFAGEACSLPPIPFELRAHADDDARGTRWIGSTLFPILDPNGKVIEVVCVHEDTTERREAEDAVRKLNATLEQRIEERTAALSASEERFRRVYELSRLGICVVHWDGRYVHVNPAYCRMLGYNREEMLGKSLLDVTPQDHWEQDLQAFNNLRETGFLSQYRKEYLRSDGGRIHAVLNSMVVRAPDGEDEVWAFVEDVTERTRAEQQLRASEEKFKSLFELSPLGMARVSWDGRFLQVNESFAQTIGYTPDEVLDLTYWDVTPREYEEQEKQILETVQQTGRFGPFEKEYIHRDGHRVPIVLSGALLYDVDGEKQLWGIAQDITQRRHAEMALKDSEQSYRALFESSSQGVMINDEKQLLEVNEAAARLLGYPKEQIIGRHPSELAAPVQPDGEPSDLAAARHIATCMRDGQTRFEWVSVRADGSEIPLDVVLTAIEMRGRRIIQAMVTDISQRKQVEQELKRALEHERELGLLKSNFVSMVSHEFRTPLGIIQSSAEILDDYLEQLSPDERREQLTSIIRNSRRMAGLMEEVLVLGRLDADRMQYQPASLDLAALCRRLVDEVHSTTEGGVKVEFFTSDLPAETQADERLLRHILINLLTNAVKYSENGQKVSFDARATPDGVQFTISDHGIGIPESEQARLFTAFQRGSNVGQRPGTGLGLVIVKRCLDLHGGTLSLTSRAGEGTTAVVTLPTKQAP